MALRIHRQGAEVGVVQAAQADVPLNLFRIGIEVLGAEPAIVVPPTVPSSLKIFLQNWSRNVTVGTLWQTDVKASHGSVREARKGLATKPQRSVSIRWTSTSPGELDELVPAVKRMTAEEVMVPIMSDHTELDVSVGGVPVDRVTCNTVDKRFYPDAVVAVADLDAQGHYTGTFITRIIASRTEDELVFTSTVSNLTAGQVLILPLINTQVLLEPKFSYQTNHVAHADLTLQEVFGPSALPPLETGNPASFAIFDGLPVFDMEPDWGTPVPVGFRREGSKVKSGRSSYIETRGARHRYALDYKFKFERADAFRFLRFFDSRGGRLQAFWQVDQEDVWTIASQSNGDTEVNITAIGSFTDFQAEFGHIGIVMNDGTVHVGAVSNIDDETTTWEVTLTAALPSLDLTQVRRVARARRVRFTRDNVTERWTTDNVCAIDVSTIELLDEKDVTL